MSRKKRQVIMTRCPLGTNTEILFQTGTIDLAFEKLNAEIVMLQTLDNKEHIKHLTQEPPLAFRDGGNVPPIWSRSKGTKTKVIGMNEMIQSHAILVAPNSNIRTPEDLRGKRLSVPDFGGRAVDPMRAMVLRGYDTILNAYGIDKSEVEFVDTICDKNANSCYVDNHGNLLVNHEKANADEFVQHHVEEIQLLKAGKIDAFFSHRSLIGQIVSKNLGKVLIDIADTDLNQVNNIYPTVITVDAKFAEHNRDIVVSYLTELLFMADKVETNPELYGEIASLGQFGATGKNQEDTREKEWYKKLRPSLNEKFVQDLISQKDFLLENGFIENDFDVNEWIDDSFLTEAYHRYKNKQAGQ